VPRFGINTSCIKDITSAYKAKVSLRVVGCEGRPSIKRPRKKQEKRLGGRLAEQEQLRGRSLEQEFED